MVRGVVKYATTWDVRNTPVPTRLVAYKLLTDITVMHSDITKVLYSHPSDISTVDADLVERCITNFLLDLDDRDNIVNEMNALNTLKDNGVSEEAIGPTDGLKIRAQADIFFAEKLAGMVWEELDRVRYNRLC